MSGFMLARVGRAWLCCGLIGHPAESPAFSCLTLNFSGKLSLLFFVCVCVCVCVCPTHASPAFCLHTYTCLVSRRCDSVAE